MSYTVNAQRKQTMLERLGEAATLIDDQRFLPFYRSIQIKLEKSGHPDEWAKMIATAKEKTNPARYFSSLCKAVKAGTYKFVAKVKEVTGASALWLQDKLVRFNFGKYQKYYVRKAQEFINVNGQAGLVDLLELAESKGLTQKYVARSLINCKSPRKYYAENVLGGAK